MKRLTFLLILSQLNFASYSQQIVFNVEDSIIGNFSSFSVDNFGRVYLNYEDVIERYSPEYVSQFSTSLKTLRPYSIETSKSFRALVFDHDRSIIQFLDNTLTDISGQIDLVSLEIQQAHLVCESFSGNAIWVFDAGSMRLIKLNELLEFESITENLGTVFMDDSLPMQMKEFNDFLYLTVPNKGLAIFDVFGTFIKMIHYKETISIDVLGNFLLILSNNDVTSIPTEQLLEPIYTEVHYPILEGAFQFDFTKNKVYFLTPSGLFMGNYITE